MAPTTELRLELLKAALELARKTRSSSLHVLFPTEEQAGELEAAEHELAHQMPHVEAVGGRIEPAIQRERTGGRAFGEFQAVGAIGHEAAPVQLLQNAHRA
jgi:hypothetical protein